MVVICLYFVISIVSAAYICRDSAKHKIGKQEGIEGFWNISGLSWAICTVVLWIPAFYMYLSKRWELIERARRNPHPVSSAKVYVFQGVLVCLMVLVIQLGTASYFFGMNVPMCDNPDAQGMVTQMIKQELVKEVGPNKARELSVSLNNVEAMRRKRKTAATSCRCTLSVKGIRVHKKTELWYVIEDEKLKRNFGDAPVLGSVTDGAEVYRITVLKNWPGKITEI